MKKVMIVDDEASVRISVRLVLETEGFKVSEAKDADECWKKLKSGETPDLILLDVMMPGMRPVDLLKKLGDDPKLKKIPVIYISAIMGIKKSSADVKGIVDSIEKPFKNEELIAKVKKALKI
jgi:CheY-like chemotaxis protein